MGIRPGAGFAALAISRSPKSILSLVVAVALAAPLIVSRPAYGDPPPWARAHGYRAKQKPSRPGPPVSLTLPRLRLDACNRELIAGAVGGAAGGLLGSRIGKGDGRLAATAAGAILGVLIGGGIGRSMDRVDQTCVGRVLEGAKNGQTVAWRNPDSGGRYEVTPVATRTVAANSPCRDYTARATIGDRVQTVRGTACRQLDGAWMTVN